MRCIISDIILASIFIDVSRSSLNRLEDRLFKIGINYGSMKRAQVISIPANESITEARSKYHCGCSMFKYPINADISTQKYTKLYTSIKDTYRLMKFF